MKILLKTFILLLPLTACFSKPENSKYEPAETINLTTITTTAAVTPTPEATRTPTPTPILKQLPEFLPQVFPAPYSQIKQELYRGDYMKDFGIDAYEGHRPVDEFGYRSNICVYLDAAALGLEPDTIYSSGEPCEYEPFTELTGYCYVIRRTTLNINGEEIAPELDQNWSPVGLVGTRGLPYWLCWPVELETGRHEATIQFRPKDDILEEFSWPFDIVE